MKKTAFFFLFLLLFITGCKQNNKYHRVWLLSPDNYKKSLGGGEMDIDAIDLRGDGTGPQFSSEAFLNLKPNGSYTSYFATYQEGDWKVDKEYLVLTPAKGDKIIFEVRLIRNDTMKLYYAAHGMSYYFKGYTNTFDKEEDNPFTAANNKWRMKAAHKESDAEIRERIKEHFHFMEKYFQWGARKEITKLRVDNVPGPFQLYGNGFGLPEYNQQHFLWKRHFYDDADSRKAYDELLTLFRTKQITWEENPNRFLVFADAYRQLQEWLK